MRIVLVESLLAASLVCSGCGASVPDTPKSGIKERATKASADVGLVSRAGDGEKGAGVVILEEFHNSRATQIQHALTMVRLHNEFGMTHVALEGYLRDRPAVDVGWFTRLSSDEADRARIAVRLLKEGEISGAEFIALTFPDVKLDPIEDSGEYDVQFTEGAPDAMIQLANLIDPSLGNEIRSKLDAATSAPIPADQQLAMAEDLERRRVQKGVQLPANVQRDWDSWLGFWRGRAGGSRTMVNATGAVVDSASIKVIAMNIGSAHTEDVAKLLSGNGRPYAVVTPLALSRADHTGDLEDGFDRKYSKKSVFTDGFIARMLERTKKPQPVLNEPWFQAKANIYWLVDRVAQRALSSGGGQPPFGLSDAELRLPYASVNPKEIAVVSGGSSGGGGSAGGGGGGNAVFPITLNPDDDRRRTTIWVKAAPITGREKDVDSTETMLKRALSEVQSENKAPTSSDDANSQVQVSTRTSATFGSDRNEVSRRILRGV